MIISFSYLNLEQVIKEVNSRPGLSFTFPGFTGLIPLLNEPAGFRKLERGLPLELLTAFTRPISRDSRSLFDHGVAEMEWCGLVPNSCLTQHEPDRAGDLLENDKI